MSEEGFRSSLQAELFARRRLQVFGRLEDHLVADLGAELFSLDALGDEPIELLVSCPGGSLEATTALVDILDVLGVEVHATVLGELSGLPIGLLAPCALRRAGPRASFLLSEEPVSVSGHASELLDEARRREARLFALAERLSSSTGGRKDPLEVLGDLRAGRHLDPPAALAYGLIDEILTGGGQSIGLV